MERYSEVDVSKPNEAHIKNLKRKPSVIGEINSGFGFTFTY